jgi:hypothetical protein
MMPEKISAHPSKAKAVATMIVLSQQLAPQVHSFFFLVFSFFGWNDCFFSVFWLE